MMATLLVCAVRDRAIDAFGQPIFVPAVGAATRSFQDEVRNPNSEFGKHPDDYDLYHIGNFDTSTGSLEAVSPPLMVAIGKSFAEPSS